VAIVHSRLKIDPDLPDFPTITHALAFAAGHVPDRIAMICEDKSMTYAQYGRGAAGLAEELKSRGAQANRVAIMMTSSIEMAVACHGGMAAGAQIACMNPNYSAREAAPLLADTDPAVIVTEPAFAEFARARAAEAGIGEVLVLGDGETEVAAWFDDAGLALDGDLPGPDDPSAMFFTGGTTGVPKGAEHIHSMMMWFCRMNGSVWPARFDQENILSVAPMFHIWGHHYANIMPVYLRATLVSVPQYKPEIVLDQFERNRISVFAGGPAAIYIGLLRSPAADTTDFSALQHCFAGGSPCPESLLLEWREKTGCEIHEGYGMSEGAPVSGNPAGGAGKLLSVGLISPMTSIKIVDIETGDKILPTGERGEICLKGPQFTRLYRSRPEETAIAIRDGWLHTGDIGYLDEDEYLFIVDRKKEMILVGGFNVYPREVDEVLTGHPSVHEAATVGAPDDFRGEMVKAFVALVPGKTVSEDELIAYCAGRLVKYKVPLAIEFMNALPKTGANKIDKLKLKGLKE
jgi:long-chain acyl-CoA synthetase